MESLGERGGLGGTKHFDEKQTQILPHNARSRRTFQLREVLGRASDDQVPRAWPYRLLSYLSKTCSRNCFERLQMRSPLVVASLLGAAVTYKWFNGLKHGLTAATGSSALSGWVIFATGILLAGCGIWFQFPSLWLFIWHCFLAPLGDPKDQKSRLDKFYEGQAQVYDKTRSGLLRGRKTMLNMSAAHLRVMREKNPAKRLVWVDVGGGTGWNIEAMDAYFPISQFDAVYLVDLCQPLLDIAQARFRARGWKNVVCLCQDASTFWLPEWSDGIHPKGSVGFVTLSYSLSMIPSYHTLLDRIDYLLCPEQGLLSVVDFYTAGKTPSLHEKAIGGELKKCGFLSRWFWQMWFDLDHVDLSPGRRNYLEYRFGTVKSYNGRNKFVVPLIVRIPYYIWLGCSRARDTARFKHAFEVEGGNIVGTPLLSPTIAPASQSTEIGQLDLGPSAVTADASPDAVVINISPPLSSFHYQLKHTWRLPYFESPVHSQFRTFIYSFTWEDPDVDLQHMELSENDSVFCIASAGDNALHYAINARPHRIHAVDMNPCQGHLVELKLAALKALQYDEFFALFGEGKMSLRKFRAILDGKLSPYLSSAAYQFWRINATAFERSFYRRGYSGWALRLARVLLRLHGVMGEMKAMCEAKTIEEQDRIWKNSLRRIFVESWLVRAIVNNPIFLWNALGVPQNQKDALTNEGSVSQFLRDTLDPIGSHALLSKGAYHYLLCLLGRYTPESCPDYLTRRGFDVLHENQDGVLDSFRLHTDSILQVLTGLTPGSITRMIIMDHLDWYEPSHDEALTEIAQMHRVLPKGGMVFWRSAAKYPWYNQAFERAGFKLTPLGIREGPEKAIDRVNMYASFWRADKL